MLVRSNLKKTDLERIVAVGNIKLRYIYKVQPLIKDTETCIQGTSFFIKFREGCKSLFSMLDVNHVPLLIVSAGLAGELVRWLEF